jgi:hypothetical protein
MVRNLFEAIEVFFETLTSIHWAWLARALRCHRGRIV